jgi:DNA polymerase-3 subunit alpha
VQATKVITTRKGDLMAFVTIEDMHGSVEITVFSRLYRTASDLLVEDHPILLEGQIQKDEQAVKIIADTVIPMDKAEETWTASVHFNLEISRTNKTDLQNLHEILQQHLGVSRGFLHLHSPENTDTIIELPDSLRLQAGSALTQQVNRLLGYNAVETRCSSAKVPAGNNGYNRNHR